jgi:ElaB/YqjD/DUF883 family membrane-anchored ribosome-binding protein
MSKAGGADAAKRALKNEAAFLRQYQDNAAAFESVAENLGKSAAEARAFIKAVDGMDDATNNFKETAKSLDQIYEEQSKLSGDTFSQLKRQWSTLALQFSKPLVWLAGVAATMLTGINKAVAAIDAWLPKWSKVAIAIPIALVGIGILIGGVVVKTIMAISALAASIRVLQQVAARAALQNGIASVAGGGKVGMLRSAGGMAWNAARGLLGMGGTAAAGGAATAAGGSVVAGAGGLAAGAGGAATAAGGLAAGAGGAATAAGGSAAAGAASTAAAGAALAPLLIPILVGGASLALLTYGAYKLYKHVKSKDDAADERKKLGNVMSPNEPAQVAGISGS